MKKKPLRYDCLMGKCHPNAGFHMCERKNGMWIKFSEIFKKERKSAR